MKTRSIHFPLLFLFVCRAEAQLVNTGQTISLSKDALMSIDGAYTHRAGEIVNDGTLVVAGDWQNDDSQSSVFNQNSTGVIEFNGAKQIIGGTNKTIFPTLHLTGSGEKILGADVDVFGQLNLFDRELKAEDFTLAILNPDPKAISRTFGFVSTDKEGKLLRQTNSTEEYLFPFGTAAISSTSIYRPVVLKTSAAETNSFSMGLVPEDPNLKGLYRSQKRQDILEISDRYYYTVKQELGRTTSDLKFFRSSAFDGSFNQLVSWTKFNLWEKASPSTKVDGSFDEDLDHHLLFTSTEPINSKLFAFSSWVPTFSNLPNPLTIFNAFSPDGDGKNDTWVIKNIDLHPDNTLSIVNRWGDEVFNCKGYSTSKSWDGGNVMSGTYYYLLNINISGQKSAYKGFITVIKKD